MDDRLAYNPLLAPPADARGSDDRDHGRIEHPGATANIIWQTRAAPPTDYENRLADALETAFGEGIVELPDLIRRLGELGTGDPDGAPWTAESFERTLKRLGA